MKNASIILLVINILSGSIPSVMQALPYTKNSLLRQKQFDLSGLSFKKNSQIDLGVETKIEKTKRMRHKKEISEIGIKSVLYLNNQEAKLNIDAIPAIDILKSPRLLQKYFSVPGEVLNEKKKNETTTLCADRPDQERNGKYCFVIVSKEEIIEQIERKQRRNTIN